MQRRRDDSATVSRGKCRRLPARYEACAASQMPAVPGRMVDGASYAD